VNAPATKIVVRLARHTHSERRSARDTPGYTAAQVRAYDRDVWSTFQAGHVRPCVNLRSDLPQDLALILLALEIKRAR
jgi:hypothetical protein